MSIAESVVDARCVGNIDGVRDPGPKELEVEVLTQNPCLRTGGVVSRGNLGLCYQKECNGHQTIDVY